MNQEVRNFEQYLIQNPNELTQEQFQKILKDVMGFGSKGTIHDETFDYLQWLKYAPGRQELFCNYLEKNYHQYFGKKVLEVGCGINAKLSRLLSRNFIVTAMDPALQKTNSKRITFVKAPFDYQSTSIEDYDLIIGLEPCDATEHIIRSCVQHQKEFIVVLCGVPHRKLNGTMPKSMMDWYRYLVSIDKAHLRLEKLPIKEFDPYIIRNKSYTITSQQMSN